MTLVNSADLHAQVVRLAGQSVLLETGPHLSKLLAQEIATVYLTVADGPDNRAIAEEFLAQFSRDKWHAEWAATATNGYLIAKRRGNEAKLVTGNIL